MTHFLAPAAALSLLCSVEAFAQSQPMPSHPDWRSQAEIVAKMEGTSVDEAVRRGHLQNFANEQLERFAQDPDFAGTWMTRDSKRFIVSFAFKGGRGTRTIANPDLARVSTFVTVAHSQMEIDAERLRLGSALTAHGISAAFGSDVKNNRLSIYASDVTKLRKLVAGGEVSIADFVTLMDGPLPVPIPERSYEG